ncbi:MULTISPECIES: hypothetical protein [Streptomyces]|uniref:hypothetical protein n=1 Tax=Streptomyces TaxID=1883 RepID=UPI0034184198
MRAAGCSCSDCGPTTSSGGCGRRTRQFTFAVSVTVRATGPITVTEHDDAVWADPSDLPAVSDETRGLLAG